RPTTPARYPAIAVSLLAAELGDLDLEVLRHQLPHGDALVEQPGGHHPLAEVRGKRARPRDDALRVVAWHFRILRARRCGEHALLDVDETEIVGVRLAVGNTDEHRIAQTAKRAAAFHPIGGVQHFNLVMLATAFERRHQFARAVTLHQIFEGFSLPFRERPESFPERDCRLYVLDALFGQLSPLAVNRLVEDFADQFWPVVLFRLAVEPSGQ